VCVRVRVVVVVVVGGGGDQHTKTYQGIMVVMQSGTCTGGDARSTLATNRQCFDLH
jgi:hypothetical protein